jgi:hypothetical protein
MSEKKREEKEISRVVLCPLTLNGFVMGWKGSEPNRSWLPLRLVRRGVIAFGGGATKTVNETEN